MKTRKFFFDIPFSLDSKNHKLLILILIVAALLRFIGTNPGHNQFHPDEGITYSSAVKMVRHNNIEPERYDYPALVPIINLVFFRTIFIPLNWGKYYLESSGDIFKGGFKTLSKNEYKRVFQDEILGHREVHAIHWARYVTAFISLGNVFLVYLLGKNLFKKSWIGLIAAFFLAVNFRAVTNAHIGLPDTYNAFFLLLAFLADLRLYKNPNKINYLLAGIALGLSVSVKYQIFAAAPFLLTHLMLSFKSLTKLDIKKLFNPWFFAAIFMIFLTYMMINPYWFAHFEKAFKQMSDVSQKYQMGRRQFMTYPFSYLIKFDYGYLESLLIILGLIISVKQYFRQSLIILSVIVPFFFIMTYYSFGGFYVRNFITTTPLLMILASLTVISIYEILAKRSGSKKWGFLIAIILMLITIKVPLSNAVTNSDLYTKPWDYKTIVDKVRPVLPEGAKVVSHPFDPLPEEKKANRIRISVESNYSLAEFREEGGDFAYINMDWAGDPFYKWMTQPFPESLRYWNKPTLELRNTFFGLSIAEMMDNVVASSYKKWQSADAALFLIKVPDYELEKTVFNIINKMTFDNEKGWNKIFTTDADPNYLTFDDQIGYQKAGSLRIGPGGTKMGIARLTSGPIQITPGYLYKITGYIKSEKNIEKKDRNGFLRIDYYSSDKNELSLKKMAEPGIAISLSSRYYGNDWQKMTVSSIAPPRAKVITLSFQVADQTPTKIWLDDVTIARSSDPLKVDSSIQKIDLEDYQDLLFPNSHGNL